jgi:hypothetical protein
LLEVAVVVRLAVAVVHNLQALVVVTVVQGEEVVVAVDGMEVLGVSHKIQMIPTTTDGTYNAWIDFSTAAAAVEVDQVIIHRVGH